MPSDIFFPCPLHSYLSFITGLGETILFLWVCPPHSAKDDTQPLVLSQPGWKSGGGVGKLEEEHRCFDEMWREGRRWQDRCEFAQRKHGQSIIMSCFCCVTRGCITHSSRLSLPWWRSGTARCLPAPAVSPGRVMRGPWSMEGLLQIDWLTRLTVVCTLTPFRDLILHKRPDKIVIFSLLY